MKFHAFLIKYAEIAIKGKNRYVFEDALIHQMKLALEPVGKFLFKKEQGRIFVENLEDFDYEDALDALCHVFGINAICPVVVLENFDFDTLKEETIKYIGEEYSNHKFTFKVKAKRADKRYPMHSQEICMQLGEALLEAFPDLSVDVHKPDIFVNVELRNKVYIYSKVIPGPGGMPLGTNGKAMLLLSGGIDSPVAGYMIAKRGVNLEAVYYDAPPYTSDRARQKVVDLAKIVAKYAGIIRLHVVKFTDIQMEIYEKCPHDELTIIMRRYMMKIAEMLAKKEDCQALVTGESIGQVASQTMYSLAVTNEVCELPVFRPLIGFDKQEIIDISEKIETFETSILPYEDCCTTFVAKHPVTKPRLDAIVKSEHKLDDVIEKMLKEAVDTEQIIVCK